MATAKPPADLGLRSELLIDKHVEYILSFTKIWEVGAGARWGRWGAHALLQARAACALAARLFLLGRRLMFLPRRAPRC